MKKTRIVAAALVAGAMAVTTALGAQADPVGPPTPRQLNGAGSDTTQDIMQDFAETITVGGVKVLGSWNATPFGSTLTNVNAACPSVPRPDGSTAGKAALANSLRNTNGSAGTGCFQWGRASSLSTSTTGGVDAATKDARQLTHIPYAFDDLGFVVTANTNITTSLSYADLKSIYECTYDPGLTAYIPQAGSGTRKSWLQYVNIVDSAASLSARPCIKDNVGGVPLQEHDGRALNPNSIMPYSVGKWLQQTTGQIADVHGPSILGAVEGGLPSVPNPNFHGKREVYNTIPTLMEANPTYLAVFGTSGAICSAPNQIINNGFALNPACGQILPANRTLK